MDVAFWLRPGIGYVNSVSFNEETDSELAAALKQLESNLEGLVLDLRGNPGGLLNEAVAVSDMFLDKNQADRLRTMDARPKENGTTPCAATAA